MLHLGTTTVEAKSGYGLDLENEIKVKVEEIGNSSDKIPLIKTIKSMVDERNIKLKNLKYGG